MASCHDRKISFTDDAGTPPPQTQQACAGVTPFASAKEESEIKPGGKPGPCVPLTHVIFLLKSEQVSWSKGPTVTFQSVTSTHGESSPFFLSAMLNVHSPFAGSPQFRTVMSFHRTSVCVFSGRWPGVKTDSVPLGETNTISRSPREG